MMCRKSFVFSFLFILCASVGYAQTPSPTPERETGFLRRSVTLRLITIDYRVYIPLGYDPAKKYPVILYLHGRGARGNDNEKQIGGAHLGSVIQLFDMKYPERYRSFIAVFPQTQRSWFGESAEDAIKALDQTVREFNGDPQRIYLMGASAGGYGSWYLAAKYPNKFAAVVPLSGWVRTSGVQPLASVKSLMPAEMFALYSAPDPYAAFAKAIGKTPVWIFHGGQDDTIDVNESRKMAAALKAAGGAVKYTEYPEEKHFIADRVFTDVEFWKWLMAQKLAQ
ncbi:MAG TPA: prolyl oligopeptidase family serine peptidase [Blastocatellia bacterium]|nr:prolyl oligopeptidase family serine peptidase [Blastocatellia bacterium]